jgi:ComF family protein
MSLAPVSIRSMASRAGFPAAAVMSVVRYAGGTHRTLCANCWAGIHFISPPFCNICGAPFEMPMGADALCGGCIKETPEFAAARAPMLYDDASKRIVLRFKHPDRTHPASVLAQWMQRSGNDFWQATDFIAPVPLHRWRLFKRRYNQAALLAMQLSGLTGKLVLVDLLVRKRATPIQGHLSRKERYENVKDAFALNESYREQITDKTVVLIDDVLTTGATVNECSRILLKAGAKAVNVLVLAWVKGLL